MAKKYYAAVKKNGGGYYKYNHVDIISMDGIPSEDKTPQYAFMFGGYKTKRKAIEIAMYYNYIIDTPRDKVLAV